MIIYGNPSTHSLFFRVSFQRLLRAYTQSSEIYQKFKAQRVRVGTQDLRIASITIANNGILLTRNQQDFEKVPGLILQDWLG